MSKTITISKEDFAQLVDQVTEFFNNLQTDELVAVSAIGLGFLFTILGIILM